jgi:hypothetical protein
MMRHACQRRNAGRKSRMGLSPVGKVLLGTLSQKVVEAAQDADTDADADGDAMKLKLGLEFQKKRVIIVLAFPPSG